MARPRRSRRYAALLVTLCLASGLVAACGGRSFDSGPTDVDDPLVRAWGMGADPDDDTGDIELQPDVVLIEGGPRAIRGVADGGLTWRLDPDAGGVDDLEVGSVMMATNFAVGRVLRLERSGDDVAVTLGPVTLTDIIRNGTLQGSGVPLEEARQRPPVAPIELPPDVAGSGSTGQPSTVVAPLRPPGTVTGTGTPFCCRTGAGVRFSYSGNGAKIGGQMGLEMASPKANFFIDIRGGSLRRAELSLSSAFGVYLDFQAGTKTGANATIDIPVPGSWSITVAHIGLIPVGLTISQGMQITTAFGSKTGAIHSSARYQLASRIGFQYSGGSFSPLNEGTFARNTSIIESMGSVAPGVMGIVFKHIVHLNLGVNAYLLDAGLQVDVETGIGATAGSGIGAVGTAGSHFVQCRGGSLAMHATFGVGFRILPAAVDVVNKFLSLFDIAPIPTRIGPTPVVARIFADTDVSPAETTLCGKPGQLGTIGAADLADDPNAPSPGGGSDQPEQPQEPDQPENGGQL